MMNVSRFTFSALTAKVSVLFPEMLWLSDERTTTFISVFIAGSVSLTPICSAS